MGKVALLGEHLGHSYSVMIHGMFGNYTYELREVAREDLEKTIRSEEYDGFNVTIPYKKVALEYCDVLSEIAKEIGAVNTIYKRDGKIYGTNTDYYGFKYMLKRNKIDPEGKKCLVLGSGGASAMVQKALWNLGATDVIVVSRKGENNYTNLSQHFEDTGIIVNATPVGMYPNNGHSLLNVGDFKNLSGVVDLVYNPNKTKMVLDAMERKIPACGGLSMLVAQAKESSECFQNKKIDEDEIEEVIYEVRDRVLNKVLIGMPGAGKTYLGSRMAEKNHRTFIDIDDMIVEKEGRSIPEIFKTEGEDYFRNVETECLREACKQTGIVIACGGGIVKRKGNYPIIKQNGWVIWVKRDLDNLDREGRPISMTHTMEELYAERKEAYEGWSDYFIDNNQDLK